MSVVFIKQMHICKFIYYRLVIIIWCFLTLSLLTFQVIAGVPVIESKPAIDNFNRDEVLVAPVVLENRAVTKKPNRLDNLPKDADASYLLKVIDELSSEVMNLRGLAEEQVHLINQMRKEGRDRYIELEERISRIANSSVPVSVVMPAVDTPKESVELPVSKIAEATEKTDYDSVFQLIRDKKFDDAEKALRQQLKDYPVGDYAGNTLYWLGEVEMARGNYHESQKAFLSVLRNYSNSAKVPDATYKLGRLFNLLGDIKQAKIYLKSVIKKYPESTAAKLSDTFLRGM